MKLTKPAYFDSFRCIAERCPDSCCKEWDVQVDPQAAALYRNLSGSLGDRLREVLRDEDGETIMSIIDGRCPMWRADGLCRIQAELGHDALCKTCREFPRLTHDYGTFREQGLELSCPEAARIILANPAFAYVEQALPGEEEPDYDMEAMDILLRSRDAVRRILSEQDRPVAHVLALILMYGYHIQAELDGDELSPFDPDAALSEAREFAKHGNLQQILDFYRDLEILTPVWQDRLKNPSPSVWSANHLTLARYFVDRYWLQAVSDYDLIGRVKLAAISCIVIHGLGGDLLQTAQIYSKEIENSIDNIEAILDAAYTHTAFTDDKLLGLLLM